LKKDEILPSYSGMAAVASRGMSGRDDPSGREALGPAHTERPRVRTWLADGVFSPIGHSGRSGRSGRRPRRGAGAAGEIDPPSPIQPVCIRGPRAGYARPSAAGYYGYMFGGAEGARPEMLDRPRWPGRRGAGGREGLFRGSRRRGAALRTSRERIGWGSGRPLQKCFFLFYG